METYTTDWMTMHTPAWTCWLAGLAGQPGVVGLEIGVFEGRATVWFLRNILTHPASMLICVDDAPRDRFAENTRPYREKIRLLLGKSQEILRDRKFPSNGLDFVYIDGSHRAPDVLEDAVLTFRLVKPGGVVIFDDYLWRPDLGPLETPRLAIDAFLDVFRGQYRVLGSGYQVAIQKT
jgi:predicted O-methyltransferase YrrM